MIIEVPLPIPRSVILSPNHIANIVPAVNMILLENQNTKALIFGSTTPGIDFKYVKYPPP